MSKCETSSADIRASRLIGRVGGLAVALGVGAVCFSGGIATADTGSDSGSGTGRSSHARSADNDTPRSAPAPRSARTERSAPRAAASTVTAQRNSASTPVVGKPAAAAPAPSAVEAVEVATAADPAVPASAPVAVAAQEAAPVTEAPTPTAVPVTVLAPVALPEVAPVTAEVAAFAAAGTDGVDPAADGSPTAPADNPLEWAVAAFARRSAVPAAAAAFQPSVCTESSEACAYILGASGVPIPSYDQAEVAMNFYLQPNSPGLNFTPQIIYTPEGAYPITGIKVLPLDISVQEGLTEVQNTILWTVGVNPDIPISYFGYSQSAIIGSLLQRELQETTGSPIAPGQIQYVTVGQEMNPNGGWFARFPGLRFNSTGIDFYGATPANDTAETLNAYPTTNYALEYDGFADFPRYPMNAISVANAVMGIFAIHIQYLNPNYFAKTYGTIPGSYDPIMGTEGPGSACNQGSSSCISLPTTLGPNGDQKYYFIKTPYLPLLAPVRAVPLIGKPLAALIEPALKVIVDLGYGDKAHGFTSAPQPMANVELPFGLFPQVKPVEVITKLVAGLQQGVNDFFAYFKGGLLKQELAGMVQALTAPKANPFKAGDLIGGIGNLITKTAATISTALSATYATLLATADFINAAVLPLQAYNTNIVLDQVKQVFAGQLSPIKALINAIGLPIAADVGMVTTVALFQVVVWLEGLLAAVTGCGPAAPSYTPPSQCPI